MSRDSSGDNSGDTQWWQHGGNDAGWQQSFARCVFTFRVHEIMEYLEKLLLEPVDKMILTISHDLLMWKTVLTPSLWNRGRDHLQFRQYIDYAVSVMARNGISTCQLRSSVEEFFQTCLESEFVKNSANLLSTIKASLSSVSLNTISCCVFEYFSFVYLYGSFTTLCFSPLIRNSKASSFWPVKTIKRFLGHADIFDFWVRTAKDSVLSLAGDQLLDRGRSVQLQTLCDSGDSTR